MMMMMMNMMMTMNDEYDHVLVPQDVDAALERFECYDDDMTTMMMMRTMSSFHRTLTRH